MRTACRVSTSLWMEIFGLLIGYVCSSEEFSLLIDQSVWPDWRTWLTCLITDWLIRPTDWLDWPDLPTDRPDLSNLLTNRLAFLGNWKSSI
jgi:hypothetical protein